jgi:tRNA-specific 2-thiouridylase
MARIIVGLSGGVDSAVAAGLLKAAGHEVIGVTLRTWQAGTSRCCRIDDAQKATAALGIPYHVMNCSSDFQEFVEAPFLTDRLRGLTPNPCIACNRYMKFELLQEYAWQLGCEAVVTGHYARIIHDEKGWHLYKALDPEKDQSYVLYNLTQETLPHTLFPLGGGIIQRR